MRSSLPLIVFANLTNNAHDAASSYHFAFLTTRFDGWFHFHSFLQPLAKQHGHTGNLMNLDFPHVTPALACRRHRDICDAVQVCLATNYNLVKTSGSSSVTATVCSK